MQLIFLDQILNQKERDLAKLEGGFGLDRCVAPMLTVYLESCELLLCVSLDLCQYSLECPGAMDIISAIYSPKV